MARSSQHPDTPAFVSLAPSALCPSSLLRVPCRFLQAVGMQLQHVPGMGKEWTWEAFLASKKDRHGKGRPKGYMVMYKRSEQPPAGSGSELDSAVAAICDEAKA